MGDTPQGLQARILVRVSRATGKAIIKLEMLRQQIIKRRNSLLLSCQKLAVIGSL